MGKTSLMPVPNVTSSFPEEISWSDTAEFMHHPAALNDLGAVDYDATLLVSTAGALAPGAMVMAPNLAPHAQMPTSHAPSVSTPIE